MPISSASRERMSSQSPSRPSRGLNRVTSTSQLGGLQNPQVQRLNSKRSSSKVRSWASNSSASTTSHHQSALEVLLSNTPQSVAAGLKELRYMILIEGVQADGDGMSSLRIYIWSILLSTPPLPSTTYLKLVHTGPSPQYSKIRDDTFRTLATDPLFRRKVSDASITRVLNSYALSSGGYVQGMNVIAAPFLYSARSEHEAYALFECFLKREIPGYVRPTLEGVHKGARLVDQILEIVDGELAAYLKVKGLKAELYAFPSVMTLCACTPPLPEVCILWDFLLAYGAHLNILCVVAQLVMQRERLLGADSPIKHLRHFDALRARKIIAIAVGLIPKIPEDLFNELIAHTK